MPALIVGCATLGQQRVTGSRDATFTQRFPLIFVRKVMAKAAAPRIT